MTVLVGRRCWWVDDFVRLTILVGRRGGRRVIALRPLPCWGCDYLTGLPEVSRYSIGPRFSSLRPGSILARSPTAIRTSWSGWTSDWAALATSSGVTASNLPGSLA